MKSLYRFNRSLNPITAQKVDIVFIDQIEAVLDDLIEVVLSEFTSDEIIFLYTVSEDGQKYCLSEKVEEAVFLDIMSDTFDTILSYSYLFPIEDRYTNMIELREDIKLFSRWVVNTLSNEQYQDLTKENFKLLRSKYGNSKAISN